ncbi:hypothetical protein GALMADRAFT_154215 [Galerina marginata CBS 339.88]|uniref:Origin recognition complex subunit 5 C-terminal domain-containing protein n=1 Tax=Galerina marginata (strain CBS 339.88) TaxID=685588 RepID=A0A067TA68_GALM3|nr:hypothetical protein GALMADRAFT_154215 [Galerina marginata CBS 339.88]
MSVKQAHGYHGGSNLPQYYPTRPVYARLPCPRLPSQASVHALSFTKTSAGRPRLPHPTRTLKWACTPCRNGFAPGHGAVHNAQQQRYKTYARPAHHDMHALVEHCFQWRLLLPEPVNVREHSVCILPYIISPCRYSASKLSTTLFQNTSVDAAEGRAGISQCLLGSTAFPLDRMNAILGFYWANKGLQKDVEENDAETRLYAREFSIPGEQTDKEIGRVGVYASVMVLTAIRFLHRTSPADRLDGPLQFKSAISYDAALALAKELKVALNDLLWDQV